MPIDRVQERVATLPPGAPVPAISLRQPWAAAVVWFGKDVENRSRWHFKHRGLVLIHASKATFYREDVEAMIERAREDGASEEELEVAAQAGYGGDLFAQGAIVGVAEIFDVIEPVRGVPDDHPVDGSPWAKDEAGVWVCIRNAIPCRPLPAKGQVGLFSVGYETATQLAELVI